MRGLLNAYVRDRVLPAERSLWAAFVYEDGPTHELATAFYELLLRDSEPDADLNATWWRTEMAADPILSHMAARAIGRSDLILFAVRRDSEPGSLFRPWIEDWPVEDGGPAILALLEYPAESTPEHGPWNVFLKDYADRKNLFYLPGLLSSSNLATAEFTPAQSESPDLGPSRISEGSTDPYLHWGLNE